MPYISRKEREKFEVGPEAATGGYYTDEISSAGELNYVFTKIILDYLPDAENTGYAAINEVIGVLECCKLELYRRLAVPYEDKKIAQNGDVYD